MLEQKPTLGLKPRTIHDLLRAKEITDACERYFEARKEIPELWIREYNEIIHAIPNRQKEYEDYMLNSEVLL